MAEPSSSAIDTVDIAPVEIRATFPAKANGPVGVWAHMINSMGRAADFFDSDAIASRATQCDHRNLNPDDGLILVDMRYENGSSSTVEIVTDVSSDSMLATTAQDQSWLAAVQQMQADGVPGVEWLILIGDAEVCENSVGRVGSSVRSGPLAAGSTIDRTYLLVLKNWFAGTGEVDQPLPSAVAMQFSAQTGPGTSESDLGSIGSRFLLSNGESVACSPDPRC